MRDFTDDLAALSKRVTDAEHYLDRDGLRAALAALEPQMAEPGFWDDQTNARRVSSEAAGLSDDIRVLEDMRGRLEDAETLHELAREEGDDSVEAELEAAVTALARGLDDLELRSLFSGEHDSSDAVCEVHSGAGGTDAQDWAEMLVRMYTRWAERRGFGVEIDEWAEGGEAGISSATFIVKGRYAYGMLSAEKGVHRLVRISPFDSQSRRQTAFASFAAVPFMEDLSAEVQVDEKDLRIDTYRSSGAGGQHVNVTDSAVRITHLPTGVVVSCQNERSQMQNKARAMQVLAAKLAERQREERRAELVQLSGPQRDVAWGSQIRSYVLAPYQLVKDLRTEHETGNVAAVLDGELDPFMEAWLRWRRAQEG